MLQEEDFARTSRITTHKGMARVQHSDVVRKRGRDIEGAACAQHGFTTRLAESAFRCVRSASVLIGTSQLLFSCEATSLTLKGICTAEEMRVHEHSASLLLLVGYLLCKSDSMLCEFDTAL